MIDGRSSIATHLKHLDDGNLVAAADTFTEDATYIRPAGGGFDVIVGRDNILEHFLRRGVRDYRHEVRVVASEGATEFVHGIVDGDAGPRLVMLAVAVLSEDGRISRYLSMGSSVDPEMLRAITETIIVAPSDE